MDDLRILAPVGADTLMRIAQQRQIGEIQRGMAQILALLGEPLEQ